MKKKIISSMTQTLDWQGPIPVTEFSHPFASVAYCREPVDLDSYGFTEEEYFFEGTSLIYEGNENLKIKSGPLNYKNRLLVRKPEPENFSGRVIIDIYNASNGYDIEDLWRRSFQYILEEGHVYIGVTSKPINVLSLKNFDYDRYESLNWAGDIPASQPSTVDQSMSIPGTEEGLIWDMLSQLAYSIRQDKAPFLSGYKVNEVYLGGQSQSGMYLNTYVYYFHEYAHEFGLFDGYLSVVGAGIMRDLNQYQNPGVQFSMREQLIPHNIETPYILLSAEGDIELFGDKEIRYNKLVEIANSKGSIRHYELASSPHTDPASPLIPKNSEIIKTKNPPKILDGEYNYTVNNLELAYYTNTCWDLLHKWAIDKVAPANSLTIDRNEAGETIKDEFGNSVGGLRSPYVEVPIARYHPNAIAEPEQIDQSVGNVNGSMNYFTKDEAIDLYTDKSNYLNKFKSAVKNQVEEGWLLENDAKRMTQWSQNIAEEIFEKG